MKRIPTTMAMVAMLLGGCGTIPENREAAGHENAGDARSGLSGQAAPWKVGRCGTAEPSDEARQTVRESLAMRVPLAMARLPGAGPYRIPVHFHVISKAAGIDNGDLPDDMIARQMDVMNGDFNHDGNRPGAQMPFEFVLASTDRWTNPAWFNLILGSPVEEEVKRTIRDSRGDGPLDLHIYTADTTIKDTFGDEYFIPGWSNYPSEYAKSPWLDGVVLYHRTLPGGGAEGLDLGHNATHEIGHWLGLYHVFTGGCSNPGDYVDDTPAGGASQGCPENKDTCPSMPGVDPIHNFMDYSTDACMNQFTPGQGDLAKAMFELYRQRAM